MSQGTFNVPEAELFVDLMDAPYSRRGSFMAFSNANMGENFFGKCTLWLSSCRIMMGSSMSFSNQGNGFRQIKLEAAKDGKAVPYVISTTPYEVILDTGRGSIRFCIAERKLTLAKCTDGLSLRITPTPRFFAPLSIDLMEESGARLVDFLAAKLLLMPIKGKLAEGPGYVEISPDASGEFLLGFEEFMTEAKHRAIADYPSYEQGVESVKADFDGFCERVLPASAVPGSDNDERLRALWQTWNMIVDPDGESSYTHSMVKMIHNIFDSAFVWQQPMQAVWLSRDKQLSWDIFRSGFYHQNDSGRLLDSLGYHAMPSSDGLKPPVHGACLLWLLKRGVYDDMPLDEKLFVWEGLEKWTEYWFRFRDLDNDGLAEFRTPLETGWEDAPYYSIGFPCADPGLNAMLALQMEALAVFGRQLGKPADICDAWQKRSEEMCKAIPEKFWDGEKWFAYNASTGQRSDARTISLYIAILLGNRLPKDIVDKSVEFVLSEDGLFTPFGFASEPASSPYFRHGFTSGSVISPGVFLMCLALEECSRRDGAADGGKKHRAALGKHGYFHIFNGLTGREDRTLTAFGERGLFWSAWASSLYLWLLAEYGL